MNTSAKALIMAGGTGGHIFPGIALANALKAKGWQVSWIGTADRMEADIVPKHNIDINFIDVKGVRGNGIKRLLSMPFMLLKAFLQARKILTELKPDIVVGFGGYASGPGGIAAKSLGIPLLLHEQNAVMGMTNRYLSKIALKTLLAFPLSKPVSNSEKFEVIGNPVRDEISSLNKLPKRLINAQSAKHILVIGGSLGARVFNQKLPGLLAHFIADEASIKVRHQAGKNNTDEVSRGYRNAGFAEEQLVISDFIDDMKDAYAWADIVICRAGALTVSEVAASGNAAIFVPLPYAVDDHQTANANWLVSVGAARLIDQKELDTEMPAVLRELLHAPALISEMQQRAGQNANLSTTDRMLSLCQAIGRN